MAEPKRYEIVSRILAAQINGIVVQMDKGQRFNASVFTPEQVEHFVNVGLIVEVLPDGGTAEPVDYVAPVQPPAKRTTATKK